jgi:hypothetical protein
MTYTKETATEALKLYVRFYHQKFRIEDMQLCSTRGYLYYKPYDASVSVRGVLRLRGSRAFELWDALKKFKILKYELDQHHHACPPLEGMMHSIKRHKEV